MSDAEEILKIARLTPLYLSYQIGCNSSGYSALEARASFNGHS